MKKQIAIILLLLVTIGCEKTDNGFTAAGPISTYLIGKWELKKIENTKTSKINTQFGYAEIMENGNEKGEDFSKIYRNGILTNTYIRARSRGTDMSVKNMTVLDRFRDDKVRFYRILNGNSQNISIEASAHLQEIGTAADTLKYYYSLAK